MHLLRKLTVAALLALPLMSSPGHALTDDKVMLEQAREHFSDRKYYFATTWLERMLKDHPSTPYRQDALLLIIKAYDYSGRKEKAVPHVRALAKEFPKAAATLDPEVVKEATASPEPDPGSIPSPSSKTAADPKITTTPTVKASEAPPAPTIKPPQQPPVAAAPAAGTAASPVKEVEVKTDALAIDAGTAAVSLANEHSPARSALPGGVSDRPPVVEPGAGYYAVTEGTTSRKKFEGMLKKLKGAGMKPIVREEKRMTEVFRLVLNTYDNKKSAEQARLKVANKNMGPVIIREGDSYILVAVPPGRNLPPCRNRSVWRGRGFRRKS